MQVHVCIALTCKCKTEHINTIHEHFDGYIKGRGVGTTTTGTAMAVALFCMTMMSSFLRRMAHAPNILPMIDRDR